jgi:hypothetical protein
MQAIQTKQSLLTPSRLLALFEEDVSHDGDPRTALCAARSILNLAYIGGEREMAAYHENPMSRYAPSECADLVCRPWRRLCEKIDAHIAALERKVNAAYSEPWSEDLEDAIPF